MLPTIAAAIISSSPDAVLVVDEDGRYLDANPAACQLLGYARDELVQLHSAALIPGDAPWDAESRARYRADGSWRGEIELLRKDGTLVPVDAWSVVISGPDGPLYAAFLRDSTTQREAQAALTRERDLLRTLMEHLPDAVYIKDTDSRFLRLNPVAAHSLGIPDPTEALSKTDFDFYPEELAREYFADEQQVITTGAPLLNRLEPRSEDIAAAGWWLTSTVPVRDASGAVVGLVGSGRDITERLQIEEALRESEERFRTAFDDAAIGMGLVDLDGRFLRVNPALCALTGYSEAELIAKTFEDITHPDDLAADLGQVNKLLSGEIRAERMEKRYRRKDGTVIWGRRNTSLLRDGQGDPLYFISQVDDITARKEAEAELAATHQHSREVLDRITDNFYALDRQGRFTYINDATERNFGYSRDELLGQNMWERFPRSMDTPLYAALQQAMADGCTRTVEFFYPPRDSWYETRIYPSHDGLSVFFRDVSERKRMEDALLQSEARFRTAFDHAAIGMSLVAIDGRFLRVNAALCGLSGYTESELLARSFQDITHPEDLPADLARIDRILTGETFPIQVEKRYLHKDGTVVCIRLNSVLVQDDHGEPLHFLSQIEDITTRVRAEEELRAALEAAQTANRAKGTFLDMMSHELRTPLQAVLGYSEFLLSTPLETLTFEQREDIGYIHRGGSRMIALINQLLDLSRMEAGRLDLATEAVDLVQVIEAVRQDVAPQAAAKGLAVYIELPPSLPSVVGDAERVRQILLNLVGNAVKFTSAGRVRITAGATTSGGVDVEVSDTGIGISADALQHIFEAFHQVDTGLTRRHGGSGLGLAIARKLAEQMGGNISVSSEPNVGTTFRLHLPGSQP